MISYSYSYTFSCICHVIIMYKILILMLIHLFMKSYEFMNFKKFILNFLHTRMLFVLSSSAALYICICIKIDILSLSCFSFRLTDSSCPSSDMLLFIAFLYEMRISLEILIAF